MKNRLLLAVFLLSAATQAQVTIDWYNDPGGVAIAIDSSDNTYTANWDYNPAGDILLTKRNSSGSVLWNASFDNTDQTRHEVATWVETDHAGDILVSGTIRSGFSSPENAASVLMKFNAEGTLLWRVVYDSQFDGSSTRKCLVDANNNIYVLGIGTGPNGQVTRVKKFDSAGNIVWDYFDSGIGAPVNFKLSPDNQIIIIHRGITGNFNAYSKIDLNGNNIWSINYIISLASGDASGDAAGCTYIINTNQSMTNPGSTLFKVSPTGGTLWSQTNLILGNRVETGSDQNPVISGYPAAGYGTAMLKYNQSGTLLWQNLDADGPGNAFLAHAQLKLDPQNAAYLAGSTMSQMGLCKVNPDGTLAWTTTIPFGYPACHVFGSDNSVYITGGTTAKLGQTVTTGLEEPNMKGSAFDVYPNPVNEHVSITLPNNYPSYTFEIFNLTGQKVYAAAGIIDASETGQLTINLKELKPGIYFCRITSGEFTETQKLFKK